MALKVLTLPLLAVRLMLDLARETPALPSGIVTTPETAASGGWWCPRSCGNSDGAFFRLVKCTTSRPPWQAATGGARHGQGYQQVGRRA